MNAPLAIIVVSYNVRDLLRECLRGLAGQRVIVVDNASTDGSAEMARTEFPHVSLITNSTNRGFAAACNQGIMASTDEFVLVLNPDTQVTGHALSILLGAMHSDPLVGACGPRILNTDGSLQPSCRRFPSLGRLALDELGLGKLFPRSRFFAAYRMTWWAHDERREVEQLVGAALLLRRKALDEAGLFDERFFMYFEEVDLCYRLRQRGWKIVFVPEATATHHGGASAKQQPEAMALARYHSMFEFYRKHYPRWQLPVLKCAVSLGALLRMATGRRLHASVLRRLGRL
jgi:hypothetical protein